MSEIIKDKCLGQAIGVFYCLKCQYKVHTMFKANEAYQYLNNLTPDLAHEWAKIANLDYTRRRELGMNEGQAKQFAKRFANTRIILKAKGKPRLTDE